MNKVVVALSPLILALLAACGSPASVIPYEEVPSSGDIVRGETLYTQTIGTMPACISCHVEGATGAPSLVDFASVAGERVDGQSAHEYTFYAIAEPGQYIVDGYGNAMYDRYDDNLSPQDIADLIAYLLEGDVAATSN